MDHHSESRSRNRLAHPGKNSSPAGNLAELDVPIKKLHRRSNSRSPHRHQSESRVAPNNLSIRPKAIPYRIALPAGTSTTATGRQPSRTSAGDHDASRLIADGVCRPDGVRPMVVELILHRVVVLGFLTMSARRTPTNERGENASLDLRGPARSEEGHEYPLTRTPTTRPP